MARTVQDRVKLVRSYCFDEDVTLVEAYSHLYHWFMAEVAFDGMNRLHRRFHKHARIIKTDLEVLKLRKDLNDHL